jgi:hypothetical protein
MRQLNKVESAIYVVGAVLMVIGAGVSLLGWQWFPYVYSMGALCYASMQLLQRYEGTNVTIRRLRRLMILSDFLLLLTGVFMFASQGNTLGLDRYLYMQYIQNNWVVLLLVAAVLQFYTSFRISNEIEKEAKKL